MGINSSTRRVTVVNDNQTGVIRISESVVQKLSQSQQPSAQHKSNEKQLSDETSRQQTVQQSRQNKDLTTNQTLFGSQSSLQLREDQEREVRRLEKSWKGQIEELQKQNRQLWQTATDKLAMNITEVEKQLIKSKCEPICRQNEKLVVDCYHTNRSQPLKCSKEVKEFVSCVQQVRRSVLNRSG